MLNFFSRERRLLLLLLFVPKFHIKSRISRLLRWVSNGSEYKFGSTLTPRDENTPGEWKLTTKLGRLDEAKQALCARWRTATALLLPPSVRRPVAPSPRRPVAPSPRRPVTRRPVAPVLSSRCAAYAGSESVLVNAHFGNSIIPTIRQLRGKCIPTINSNRSNRPTDVRETIRCLYVYACVWQALRTLLFVALPLVFNISWVRLVCAKLAAYRLLDARRHVEILRVYVNLCARVRSLVAREASKAVIGIPASLTANQLSTRSLPRLAELSPPSANRQLMLMHALGACDATARFQRFQATNEADTFLEFSLFRF